MPRPAIDIAGMIFGTWTVLERADSKYKVARWLCRCTCGIERVISGASLRSGGSRNCGCQNTRCLKHGESRSREYYSWRAMMQRCYTPTHVGFKNYGGRGITVCPEWHKFEQFLADMGRRPPARTLDRVDNEGPYAPSNCRWATASQQNQNRRRKKT